MLKSCVYNVVNWPEHTMLPEPSVSGPVSFSRCLGSAEVSFPQPFYPTGNDVANNTLLEQ